MSGAEVRKHPEEVVGAGRVDAPDPQLAAEQTGELLELAVHAVDLGQNALRIPEDHAPLVGELDAARGAAKDLDPQLLLESADLL